ncbi:MAG: hypothetical protein LBG59_06715 [Candidatus Peribacteria bacterium]|nr:hypothetical protein [Candidatus Peribacteria bacterium]
MAKILKEMGLEDYADQTALKNVETKRQTSVGKMMKEEETRKTVLDAWKTSGRNDDFTVTRTNERGEKEEVEFKANDISANPDYLKHFMEYNNTLPENQKNNKHNWEDNVISTIKDASEKNTLEKRLKITTDTQRAKILEAKQERKFEGDSKVYTIKKDSQEVIEKASP